MQVQRQPDKNRFLAALALQPSSEVPFFEADVAANIVDIVLGRNLDTALLQLEAPDKVEFLQRTGIDIGYLHVRCDAGRKNLPDDKGRMQYVNGTIKSRADFDKLDFIGLDLVRRWIESFLEAADGTGIGCSYALDEAARMARIAIGPTDFAIAMYDNPGFVNELMERMEAFTLAQLECVLEYPVDVLFLTGPVCTNQAPMYSPEMHRQFIFPRIEKMMNLIRPSGIPVVLHTDGDNTQFLDWIVQTGFAGLHPIEPGDGKFDIYQIKRVYGNRICLLGNIDLAGVLTGGTPDEVRADTLEHLDRLSMNGGYICGSSHEVTELVPFENFRAVSETVCSYAVKGES